MNDLPPPADPDPTASAGPPASTDEQQAVDDKQPWPGKAKTAVAILAVVALLGVAGTIIGFTRASSEQDAGAETEQELAAALARAEEAEGALAEIQVELAEAQAAVEATSSERDEALATVDELEASLAELDEELKTAQEEVAARDRIIEDLASPYPVQVDPDLADIGGAGGLDGQYSIVLTEIRCFNLPQCGSPPALPNVTLARAGDQLLLNVPGRFQIPMFGRNRQLFGTSDQVTLIEGCGTEPRTQSTRISLHAGSGQVLLGGEVALSTLGASVTVDAPATAECPAGEVWYAATLTRLG